MQKNKRRKIDINEPSDKDNADNSQHLNSYSNQKSEGRKKRIVVPTPGQYDQNWKLLCKEIGISHTPKSQSIKKASNDSSSSVKKEKSGSIKGEANSENENTIWFDDVDEILLPMKPEDKSKKSTINIQGKLIKSHSFEGLTKIVALDCEMVGSGVDGDENLLARVSIVNQFGHCILDKYVTTTEKVTDYRTHVSGITEELMKNGEDFKTVQAEVSDILKGRILVGHALKNDLQVLFLDHPRKKIRDTQRFKPFRDQFNGRLPALKKLSAKVLNVGIQGEAHSSVEDAQAAMRLYTMYKTQWESSLSKKKKKQKE